jgi:hypothetical protein
VSLALGILPSDLDISARDLMEWAAFERVQGPILIHDRIDAAFARLSASLSGTSQPAEDFLPRWDTTEEPQSPQQMIAVFESAFAQAKARR